MELNVKNTAILNEKIIHVHVPVEKHNDFELLNDRLNDKSLQLTIKRLFDIFVALFLALLFSPFLLLIALIIKLTSRGPVLYSNERVGLCGHHFKCHKFRSMVSDHSIKHDDHKKAIKGQQAGILHKEKNDTRITWIGKIIRKTSMDELPQLFNVLQGDMSIVGPRPLVPFMLKPYPEFRQIRCMLRPGITGLWQIRDRENNTSAEFMVSHDTEYIKNYSLFLDFKILFETPIAVISGKGAY